MDHRKWCIACCLLWLYFSWVQNTLVHGPRSLVDHRLILAGVRCATPLVILVFQPTSEYLCNTMALFKASHTHTYPVLLASRMWDGGYQITAQCSTLFISICCVIFVGVEQNGEWTSQEVAWIYW